MAPKRRGGVGRPIGVPGEVQGQYLDLQGTTIELLWFESCGPTTTTPRPMNQIGFTHLTVLVYDLGTTVERVVAHGGKVLESTRVDYDRRTPGDRWSSALTLMEHDWRSTSGPCVIPWTRRERLLAIRDPRIELIGSAALVAARH